MFLRRAVWSPYISGIVIGLLQIPIFLILGASLGTSGSFGSVACSLLDQGGSSGCFPLLKNWWQLGLVVGIALGAYLSRRLSHVVRKPISPLWASVLKTPAVWPRLVMAFCGGFIFLLGARLADGCTSGNGISGMALLSVGSYIVIACMFIGGYLITILYPKR
jgi:hypothetical protein